MRNITCTLLSRWIGDGFRCFILISSVCLEMFLYASPRMVLRSHSFCNEVEVGWRRPRCRAFVGELGRQRIRD